MTAPMEGRWVLAVAALAVGAVAVAIGLSMNPDHGEPSEAFDSQAAASQPMSRPVREPARFATPGRKPESADWSVTVRKGVEPKFDTNVVSHGRDGREDSILLTGQVEFDGVGVDAAAVVATRLDERGKSDGFERKSRTKNAGAYSLSLPEGRYLIAAAAKGHLLGSVVFTVPAAVTGRDVVVPTIELVAGVAIRGRVLSFGVPMASAGVRLRPASLERRQASFHPSALDADGFPRFMPTRLTMPETVGANGPDEVEFLCDGLPPVETRFMIADDDGTFALNGLLPSDYVVEVGPITRSPGSTKTEVPDRSVNVRAPSEGLEIDLRLCKLTIDFDVVGSEANTVSWVLADAQGRTFRHGFSNHRLAGATGERRPTTTYITTGRSYVLKASAVGHKAVRQSFEITPELEARALSISLPPRTSTSTVEILFSGAATSRPTKIRCVLTRVDASGRTTDDSWDFGMRTQKRLDVADGRALWEGVAVEDGEYRLDVGAEDEALGSFVYESVRLRLSAGMRTEATIHAVAGGFLSVGAFDPSNEPIAATVTIHDAGGDAISAGFDLTSRRTSTGRGTLSFFGKEMTNRLSIRGPEPIAVPLAPGAYDVMIEHPDFAPLRIACRVESASTTEVVGRPKRLRR